jgi:4-diphosphocytidyl-2-C-methyl-D-erythritol kinase
MQISCNAKLNLALRITGTNALGYHLIDSLFVPISFCDTLYINRCSGKLIITNQNGAEIKHIPKNSNTCLKAISAFQKFTNITPIVDIKLVKRVPAGGGLGGGSSDGAGVIKALNKLYRTNLSNQDMIKIAKEVGADVPFFIINKPCRVQGIGEVLTPADINYKHAIIFMPKRIHCDTKKVYNRYDTDAKTNDLPASDTIKIGENDLLRPAMSLYPKLEAAARLAQLVSQQNNNSPSGMSGSGSTFWTICPPDYNLIDTPPREIDNIEEYLAENNISWKKVEIM